MLSPKLTPTRFCVALGAWLFLNNCICLAGGGGDLVISEFSAASDGSFPDEDGDASDWIELRNASTTAVSLGGYFLTDTTMNLRQWELPDIDLQAGALLLVFASGKDRAVAGAELHTNFSLSDGGEYLGLIAPDGTTVACDFDPEFPRQFRGISYGSTNAQATVPQTFIETPAAARWFVPTSDIGDTWRDTGFDDNSWGSAAPMAISAGTCKGSMRVSISAYLFRSMPLLQWSHWSFRSCSKTASLRI